MQSVSLGNGSEEYPLGDEVGVVSPFKLVRSAEDIAAEAQQSAAFAVAQAVLAAMGENSELPFVAIQSEVTGILNRAGVTSSTTLSVIRAKVTAALAGREGMLVSDNGHLVRLRAEQRGPGNRAPWFILRSVEGDSRVNWGVLT